MNKTSDLRDQKVMGLQVETIEKIASFPYNLLLTNERSILHKAKKTRELDHWAV